MEVEQLLDQTSVFVLIAPKIWMKMDFSPKKGLNLNKDLLRFQDDKVFAFIDCETLNLCLHPFHNLPWQISIVESIGGQIKKEHDFFVDFWGDHPVPISEDAKRITRFSQERFDSLKKDPEEAVREVFSILERADYIGGHNLLGFDVYVLRGVFKKYGLDWKMMMPKIVDTLALMKGVRLEAKYDKNNDTLLSYQYKQINTIAGRLKCSLGALGKEFDIDHDYDRLHDGLVDLRLNLKVWNKIKYMVEI